MRLLSFPLSVASSTTEGGITFWKKEPRNPTPDDIPPYDNVLWLNTQTGEVFVHLKTCLSGGAVWKGQLGTIVSPSTVSKVDFFGDGSAIGLWRFEDNPYDEGGVYDGEWVGTEAYDTGVFGKAAKFTGQGYIQVKNLVNPFKSDFTIAFRFKAIKKIADGQIGDIILAGNSDYKFGLSARLYNSTNNYELRWAIGDGGKWLEFPAVPKDFSLNDLEWHFIIVTKEGKTYRFYKDGELWYSYTAKNQDYQGDAFVRIGVWGNGSYYGTNFLLDQLRLFNRSISDEEVKVLENELEDC